MRRCPRCGMPTPPGDSLCTECGHRLNPAWRKRTAIGWSIAVLLAGAGFAVLLSPWAKHVATRPGTSPGSSNRGWKERREADFMIGYPATLRVDPPLPSERMVFLAQSPGRRGGIGETLALRKADRADTALSTDVEMLNALQSFEHPGWRLLVMRRVSIPGAATAFELYAAFRDPHPGGALLRQLDLVIRTPTQRSYHLLLVGSPTAVNRNIVHEVINRFRINGHA